MSVYYKYDFVSPEPVFAIVREELKNYFDSGAVDDLMFPTYLNKCLNRLGKGTYKIVEEVLTIEDYQSKLPDNFYKLREAWACVVIPGTAYRTPNSFYSQAASTDTIQVTPVISAGQPCTNTDCSDENCPECMPELIQAVYKTNNEVIPVGVQRQYLLKPGNISTQSYCSNDCKNFGSNALDSFDIRDNKFVVNFKNGTVYLILYVTDYDDLGGQLIPDNLRIKEYIEQYLKYKVFETLTNQVNDETYNQLERKMGYYKSLSDEAFILAENEIKKQTANQKITAIKRNLNALNRYELPTGRRRGYRY